MIKVTLTNEILKRISEIDEKRFSLSSIEMPPVTKNRLRKNSKKKSSYASNKIEGNPLTEKQANEAIDSDPHKHFLKPEQEVRNYFLALNVLEEKLKKKLEALEQERDDREYKSTVLSGFLFEMMEFEYLDAEFTDARCIAMLDHVTIYADGRMVYSFLNGSDITVMV